MPDEEANSTNKTKTILKKIFITASIFVDTHNAHKTGAL